LRLDVLPSDQPCGFGNITIDGQPLPQNLDADTRVSSGKGSISTSTKSVIVGSWTFDCIAVNGKPDGQLLLFTVHSVDGESTEDVAFSVLFKQTGETEIMNIEIKPAASAQVLAGHSREGHHESSEGHHVGHTDAQGPHDSFNIHKEIAELRYMEAQLEELKWLIHEKKHAIRRFAHHRMDNGIKDCDSLRCVARKTYANARDAASRIYGKITGDDAEFDHFSDYHLGKYGGKNMDRKPGKGPHGRPGNHTCPDHDKKNHTSPHHHHHGKHPILPICRYPPPFSGHPPHGHMPPPPPHMPHPPHMPSSLWDDDYTPEHDSPFGGPWDYNENGDDQEEVRPPFHNGEDNDVERHGGFPHEDEPGLFDLFEKPDHPHGRPPFDQQENNEFEDKPFHGPPHVPNGAEPNHDGPSFDMPPPPLHDGPHDGPHGGPPGFPGDHGPPPPHGTAPLFHVLKFSVIGFLFAILIITIRRRTCNPKKRAARQARREERHRKRAYRRAASRYAFSTWWARLTGNGDNYEDKEQALLDDMDSDTESTMSDDITTFQNTVDVVSEMVAAEEGRSMSSVQTQPQAQPIVIETRQMGSVIEDYASDAEEEILPAYEDNDNDGSEASSFVADGFRYTPGSSDYSPSHSASGNVSDILGNDSKQ
jgi:hypothetical protein